MWQFNILYCRFDLPIHVMFNLFMSRFVQFFTQPWCPWYALEFYFLNLIRPFQPLSQVWSCHQFSIEREDTALKLMAFTKSCFAYLFSPESCVKWVALTNVESSNDFAKLLAVMWPPQVFKLPSKAYNKAQLSNLLWMPNSVSKGFGLAMRTSSSRRFKRYPKTYMWVSVD